LFLSDVRIHHIGYQDATVRQRKLNRDVRLLRMDYAIDPDNVSTLLHLGLAYFHLGRIEEAREHLRHLLTVSRTPGDHLRQVFGVLTTIAMLQGDLDEALATVEQGLRLFPDSEHLLYLRADCLYELDRYEEAKAMLIRIVNSQSQQVYYGGLPGDIREKLAPRKLADVHRLQRNFAAAEAILRSVVGRFPSDTHSWHLLGRVYLDSGQREKLLAVVERLRSCPQGDIFGSLLLAVWRLARREMDEAGREIEQLIGLAPQMPMPRVLRAQWLTLINAPIPERMQACRDILRLLPGHLDARRMLSSLEAAQHARDAAPTRVAHSSVLSGAGLPDAVGLT
jgi:tetratricopeptide (TPR) repeat protein